MADAKLTALTAASALDGSELVYGSQGGNSRKITTAQVRAYSFATDATIHTVTIGLGAGSIATNTALGASALAANTTGSQNVAVGYLALTANTTGDFNTGAGRSVLASNTTGVRNTASGYSALGTNTTGSYNVATGMYALVGNTTGEYNVASGYSALAANTTGSYNTALGAYALYSCTTGNGNIEVGGLNNSGSFAPVFNVTTEDNRVVIGSTAVTNAYINVAWTVVSDRRDKTEFGDVPHGLDFVQQLTPIAYKRRKARDTDETDGVTRYGFGAQDILALEGANPVIVDAENPDMLRLNSDALIPILVNAIKELTARVAQLENA